MKNEIGGKKSKPSLPAHVLKAASFQRKQYNVIEQSNSSNKKRKTEDKDSNFLQ
jgi:hypothetical protein